MTSAPIEFRNVTLRYDRDTVLEKVALAVADGEALVLIGPSGQGKSTALKLMAGLVPPTSGEVLVEGKSYAALSSSERERLARKVGMLFQKNALFDSLTVGENVAFPLREVTNERPGAIAKAVDYYLEAVGLAHVKNLLPDEISGGMQKRLGIARALVLKPKILFYDDPTAGLDPITSRTIIQLIIRLKQEMGTTVVAVTNDMSRARQLGDRIAMVVDREIIDCGTPTQMDQNKDPRVRQFIRGELTGPLTVTA